MTTHSPMDTMWLQRAANAAAKIERERYYPLVWAKLRPTKPWGEMTKREALKVFQDFWEALPDTYDIQKGDNRSAFFDICDLAEEYCFGTPGWGENK